MCCMHLASARAQISAVVAAAGTKPVNLLVGGPTSLSLQDIAALGVRRVSLGGALARAAWGGLMQAAQPIMQDGRFDCSRRPPGLP